MEQQHIENWINKIDHTTNRFIEHFGSLSEEQLNWKSSTETWSIAQNIDHLIVINQTYFPVLADLKSGNYKTPFLAKFPFIVSFLGKTILKASDSNRKKKIKTFPIWEPCASHLSSDLVERFAKHQSELKQEVVSSEELIKNGAVISSPANKNIVYRLETAFDIIVAHEQRHLEQSKETLQLLRSLASSH